MFGNDLMVRTARGHGRERPQDGHSRPTVPHPNSTGPFQQDQGNQLPNKEREATTRHREEHGTCGTSQTRRSQEGRRPSNERAEITRSMAVEMGNKGGTTMVLGGEWTVGPFTQPRIHADMGGTLGEPLTTNYCMYRVRIGRPEVYPAPKTTGIWTNIQVNLKTCPRSGWHRNHPSTIGGAASRRVTLPTMDPYPAKRWTPQELQLDLHLATLSAEDQERVQGSLRAAWPQ